jgi:hypothetical protein
MPPVSPEDVELPAVTPLVATGSFGTSELVLPVAVVAVLGRFTAADETRVPAVVVTDVVAPADVLAAVRFVLLSVPRVPFAFVVVVAASAVAVVGVVPRIVVTGSVPPVNVVGLVATVVCVLPVRAAVVAPVVAADVPTVTARAPEVDPTLTPLLVPFTVAAAVVALPLKITPETAPPPPSPAPLMMAGVGSELMVRLTVTCGLAISAGGMTWPVMICWPAPL